MTGTFLCRRSHRRLSSRRVRRGDEDSAALLSNEPVASGDRIKPPRAEVHGVPLAVEPYAILRFSRFPLYNRTFTPSALSRCLAIRWDAASQLEFPSSFLLLSLHVSSDAFSPVHVQDVQPRVRWCDALARWENRRLY